MSITRCKAWCSVILGHVCRQKMVPWTRAMANLPVPQSIVPHLLGENPTRRSLGMTNLHQTALIVENLPATYLFDWWVLFVMYRPYPDDQHRPTCRRSRHFLAM